MTQIFSNQVSSKVFLRVIQRTIEGREGRVERPGVIVNFFGSFGVSSVEAVHSPEAHGLELQVARIVLREVAFEVLHQVGADPPHHIFQVFAVKEGVELQFEVFSETSNGFLDVMIAFSKFYRIRLVNCPFTKTVLVHLPEFIQNELSHCGHLF